jgi:hypothetical protein
MLAQPYWSAFPFFKSSDRTRRLVAAGDDSALQVCGTVTQCPDKCMRRVLRTATAVYQIRGTFPAARVHRTEARISPPGRAQAG